MKPVLYPDSHFHIDCLRLPMNHLLLEKAMGYPEGTAPVAVKTVIDEVLKFVGPHVRLEGGYVIIPPDAVKLDRDAIRCDAVDFSTGPVIAEQLKKAVALSLFAVTAGPGVEEWSRQLMAQGDYLKGFIVDAYGSEIVELAADWMAERIQQEIAARQWKMTNRFGPGYCGWPVAEQQKLFSLLPSGFCGIRLSPSALMMPLKSVSGVIGLGPSAEKTGYVCSFCERTSCFRRRM
jgi:hypothetical protein